MMIAITGTDLKKLTGNFKKSLAVRCLYAAHAAAIPTAKERSIAIKHLATVHAASI